MPLTVLETKFYYPPVRETIVSRLRLVERLHAEVRLPLVLVSAPAGYGKTTLLSEWHAGLGRDYPLAWITLDQEDNDPACFLTGIITTLRTIKPGLGENTLALLDSNQTLHPERILAGLINELNELEQPFILVLDDYHVIDERSIHHALAYLLDHIPPRMHLIILTRADPSLPLSRLRSRGQLAEIRAADLRFSPKEADEFLNQCMRLGLSSDQVRVLEESTEGWIAGLQLAALSIQGREDIQGFISSFTGRYHYIADYLIEEVLNRQADEIKEFLLKTSILERMTGGLCDALTGARDGQATLELLAHINLFVIPLDDEQVWYRYHHLFVELLRNRVRSALPESISGLHRQASNWCAQNGLVSEAIQYALSGSDFEQAARLIEKSIPSMQRRGELRTISNWVNRLPEEIVHSKIRLCISYAWAVAFSAGAPDRVEHYLQYAHHALQALEPSSETQDLMGQIAAIRANLSVFLGDNAHALEYCAQALGKLSEENLAVRGYVSLMQADASWMMGDGSAAISLLKEAVRLSRLAKDLPTALSSMNYLARVLIAHGSLRQAQEVFHDALHLAQDFGAQKWPSVGIIYIGLGMLLWEQNDAGHARDYLTKGIELAILADDVDSLLFGYTTLARIYQAGNDTQQAREMIENAERVSGETKLARDRYRVATRQVRLMLSERDVQAAARWSKELSSIVDEYSARWPLPLLNPMRISEQILQARVMVAQSHPTEAIERLASLLSTLEAAGRMRSVIEILAFQAIAFQAQGNLAGATTALVRALTLAQPEGWIRLFVDEGQPMEKLLLHMRSTHGELNAYTDRLLDAFKSCHTVPEKPSPIDGSQHGIGLVEPLSQRELEVLRLIAVGCSNQEIAHELVLAIGTVKRHTANIFSKLAVRNRTEAVARARELNLL